MTVLFFVCLLLVRSAAQEAGSPSINGNIGLQGSGYGDVYGGTVKEGVYGAGGRIGGGLNLLGTAGYGRRKRQSATATATANATGSDGQAIANAFAVSGSFDNFPAFPFTFPGMPTPPPPAEEPAADDKPCSARRKRSAAEMTPIYFPVIIVPASMMNGMTGAAFSGSTVNGVSSIATQTVDGSGTVVSSGGIVLPGTRIIPHK